MLMGLPYALTGHMTWQDLLPIIYEYVNEAAVRRGESTTEFVRYMAVQPEIVASELTNMTGLIVTRGQVKKWCKRWLA